MRTPSGHGDNIRSPRTVGLIPARIGSTRLPEKPLVPLGGAPLIWQVFERVRRSEAFDAVYVTTDDPRVEAAVVSRGGSVIRVDVPCPSGTARVALAALQLEAAYVVNVQGDEPFIEASDLLRLVACIQGGAEIATLAAPLDPERRADASTVKVVTDSQGNALYFSRAPIPGRQHVGVYGFHAEALQAVAHLPRSPASQAEDLEQLTWLHHGWSIAVCNVPATSLSIDTPADLERAAARFSAET